MLYLYGVYMSQNPLQKYFRQPKLYVSLPSKGLYTAPDVVEGDPTQIPVYSMTGMDEILLKTPDALFNGESTVKVIQSCCATITNGWQINAVDLDHLLIAIRIATYGNMMTIEHTCSNCSTENEYEIDLGLLNDHFNHVEFHDTVDLGDVKVKIRPLTYKEMTTFNLENYTLQKMLIQSAQNFDNPENQKTVNDLYTKIAALQTEVFIQSIDSVEIPDAVVNQQSYIKEWITNSESELFEKIKDCIEDNRKNWKLPAVKSQCSNCGTAADLEITMDQASFFVRK
jgi:hypothetical protein